MHCVLWKQVPPDIADLEKRFKWLDDTNEFINKFGEVGCDYDITRPGQNGITKKIVKGTAHLKQHSY